MKQILWTFAAFALCLLTSCKNIEEESLQKTYYTTESLTEPTFKVYTSDGEMTDEAELSLVYDKYGPDIERMQTGESVYNRLVVVYVGDTRVVADGMMYTYKRDTLLAFRHNDVICWEKQEPETLLLSNQANSPDDVLLKLFKYRYPYSREEPLPHSSYEKQYIYKFSYFVKSDGDYLYLPMVNYCFIRREAYYYRYNLNNFVNNEFCSDSLAYLGPNDTIIVGDYLLSLRKVVPHSY